MISGEELGVKIYLSYEDERYPTLVLQSDVFGSVGYDLNLATGELGRVCICSAHSENECVCGAWDEAKLKERNGIICDSSSQTQSSENISNKGLTKEQKPMAWIHRIIEDGKIAATHVNQVPPEKYDSWWESLPLYAAPPKREWVGLTDEDRYKAIRPLYNSDENARLAVEHSNDEYEAIEAKLKEKNT